jgi:hypothetical protein
VQHRLQTVDWRLARQLRTTGQVIADDPDDPIAECRFTSGVTRLAETIYWARRVPHATQAAGIPVVVAEVALAAVGPLKKYR